MRPDTVLDPVGLPVNDPHPAVVDTQRVGRDLRHHRLETLPDRGAAGDDFDSAGSVDRDRDPVEGTQTALLDKDGETGPDRLAGGPTLSQRRLQRIPSDGGQCLIEQPGIIARIIDNLVADRVEIIYDSGDYAGL